jgi:hypothetical protein
MKNSFLASISSIGKPCPYGMNGTTVILLCTMRTRNMSQGKGGVLTTQTDNTTAAMEELITDE